jgi:hypothetical protein
MHEPESDTSRTLNLLGFIYLGSIPESWLNSSCKIDCFIRSLHRSLKGFTSESTKKSFLHKRIQMKLLSLSALVAVATLPTADCASKLHAVTNYGTKVLRRGKATDSTTPRRLHHKSKK